MGRQRRPLTMTREGHQYVTRFKHPLSQRVIRIALGDGAEAGARLSWLNNVFMNENLWRNLPDGHPDMAKAWGAEGIVVGKGSVRKSGKVIETNPTASAILQAKFDAALAEIDRLRNELRRSQKEAEHWKGSKIRKGPCPELGEARDAWLALYKGRDEQHARSVKGLLSAFVHKFGVDTPIDDLVGREREISAWMAALPISPSRRQQLRIYVLKMLSESGVTMDRKQVPAVKAYQIRAARKPIRWLSKKQASAVAKALRMKSRPLKGRHATGDADYWSDLFRVQVGLGLRPDELLTLRRENFSENLSRLTLAPLDHLTLKHGPRTLTVPASVARVLRARFRKGDVAFPDPRTGKPWVSAPNFDKLFARQLKRAGTEAGIPFDLDCRVGRRTCGSLLLRAGLSTESVAAVLGNSPEIVREHYARIMPTEVDTSAAALR